MVYRRMYLHLYLAIVLWGALSIAFFCAHRDKQDSREFFILRFLQFTPPQASADRALMVRLCVLLRKTARQQHLVQRP